MKALIHYDQVSVLSQEKVILSEFSFSLLPGEKAALSGKSGSGKSSVLKALLGLLPISKGMIYFDGQALTPVVAQTIRSCTAYIGQEPILGADTVREVLLLPFQFKAHREHRPTDAALVEVLDRLQLPAAILEQDSNRISGGEKQRIALARGLLLGKRVYLLDEVTSALDAQSKQAVFEVFSDPSLTILSVAHDPEWLARCGLILELEAGRLVRMVRHDNTGH